MKVYVLGALKNPRVPVIANRIEADGHEVFADWFSPGPEADSFWRDYETTRGRDFLTAIRGPHAVNIFEFDKKWLIWANAIVMVAPCGNSGHYELGWGQGRGKWGAILLENNNPARWDVMYQYADLLTASEQELLNWLRDLS